LMRIGLIADVHGNLSAFRAVMREMPRVEKIFCAGDLVGMCVRPKQVVRLVKRKKISCVLGDCDLAVITGSFERLSEEFKTACAWTRAKLDDETMKFLRGLPKKIETKIGGFKIMVVHGSPSDALYGRVSPEMPNESLSKILADVDADIVIIGHTHLQFFKMFFGKLVINPGSVGHPKDRNPNAGFAVLDLRGENPRVEIKRVKYPVEEEISLMKKESLPSSLASRLLYGW